MQSAISLKRQNSQKLLVYIVVTYESFLRNFKLSQPSEISRTKLSLAVAKIARKGENTL